MHVIGNPRRGGERQWCRHNNWIDNDWKFFKIGEKLIESRVMINFLLEIKRNEKIYRDVS